MITTRIYRGENDTDGAVVQMFCLPRLNETISIPDADGVERDLKVTAINHWVKPIEKHLQQVEVVLSCEPEYP